MEETRLRLVNNLLREAVKAGKYGQLISDKDLRKSIDLLCANIGIHGYTIEDVDGTPQLYKHPKQTMRSRILRVGGKSLHHDPLLEADEIIISKSIADRYHIELGDTLGLIAYPADSMNDLYLVKVVKKDAEDESVTVSDWLFNFGLISGFKDICIVLGMNKGDKDNDS